MPKQWIYRRKGQAVSYTVKGEELRSFAKVLEVRPAGFDGAPKSLGVIYRLSI